MPSTKPLPSPLLFRGDDFDEMVETIMQNTKPFKAAPNAAVRDFPWEVEFASSRTLAIARTWYGADWTLYPGEGIDAFTVLLPREGGCEVQSGSRAIDTEGAMLLVSAQQVDKYRMLGKDGTNGGTALILDGGQLTAAVSAMLERPIVGSLDLEPRLERSTSCGQMLEAMVRTLDAGLFDGGPLTHSPIAMARLTEALVALLIETVPHRFSGTVGRKAPSALPRHVKRAVDFMHANMARALSSTEIAHAGGVSVRSLEEGFRQFKGVSPMAYLRRIRLDAVRAELCAPEGTEPIAQIALKWGFAHLGRFSAFYRQVYGELPSETVTRRRP